MSKINFKELIKGIIIIILYFASARLLLNFFSFLIKSKILPNTELTGNILYFLTYVIIFTVLVIIYHKTLIDDFKKFNKNKKDCIKTGFNYWLKGLFIMMTSNIIINFVFKLGTSVNEQSNITLIKQSPYTLVPIIIFFAPVIEELVFRKSFYKVSDDKHIFAWISGLIFGGVHIISSLSDIRALVFLVPYCSVGIAFGYLYKKTDTIYSSLAMHMFHNTLNVLIILLAIKLGVSI